MANRTLTTLTAVLQMNNSKFKKGISGSQRALKGFSKQVDKIGGMLAGAFAVSSIVKFGKEVVNLSAKAEGVEAAFRGLGSPGLLRDLQVATRGTVNNLQLMQAAVKAKNFKIPLEQLAGYFEFATNRAIQTGESVEYLTQSIIDGIGRKSALVLDNLGISAAELQAEMKKVGDFGLAAGNIIARSLEEAGDVASTLATSIAQITTAWTNFQISLGNSDLFQWLARGTASGIDKISALLNRGVDPEALEAWTKFSKSVKDKKPAEQAALLAKEIEKQVQGVKDLAKTRQKLTKELANYEGQFGRQKRIDTEQQIALIDAEQNTLLDIRDIYEGQLSVLEKIVEEQGKITGNLPAIKKAAEHILPEGFQDPFSDTLVGLHFEAEPTMDEPSPVIGKTLDELKAIVGLQGEMDAFINSSIGGMDKAFGSETFDKVDKVKTTMQSLGENVGIMMVNQFDQLGVAIGKFASGAEDSFRSLGDAIMQNLGNILIMMGAKTGNIPLVLAGAAIQLGGGILRGLGSKSPSTSKSGANSYGDVNFRISGPDLVGALDRQNYSKYMNT